VEKQAIHINGLVYNYCKILNLKKLKIALEQRAKFQINYVYRIIKKQITLPLNGKGKDFGK